MNEDQHDSPPANATDRALMEYLEEILGEPAPGRARTSQTKAESAKPESAKPDAAKAEKVTPLEAARPRSNGSVDAASTAQKSEPRQNVTLPFRTAEKPKVLSSLNLLNLKTAPAAEPVKPKPELVAVKPAAEPVAQVPAIAPSQKIETDEAPAHALKPVVESEPAVAPLLPQESVSAEQEEKLPPVSAWCDNGRPPWAQERFECLIFNVSGLKLAVPLITLGAIHRIDRKFNALPHQHDWFIGILQTPAAGNIKVLDTALCVMPERHDPAARETLAYVITIHGYRWGLACHEVEKSITLEPHQVKWRTQRGKRPWLAGTVIDHMCALIDTDGFRDVILKAEQPR